MQTHVDASDNTMNKGRNGGSVEGDEDKNIMQKKGDGQVRML